MNPSSSEKSDEGASRTDDAARLDGERSPLGQAVATASSSVFCPCCGMPADADYQGYCRNGACDVRTFRLPMNFQRKNNR